MTRRRQPLSSMLTRRLFWIAAIVVIANWVIITAYYTSDEAELEGQVISAELGRLEHALIGSPPKISDAERTLFTEHSQSYAFALMDDSGNILDSENFEMIPATALETGMFAQDWVTHLSGSEPRKLVASRKIESRLPSGGRLVFVMSGDPAGLTSRALISELMMHVWLPILPMALVLIGANALMIRHGLKPVATAARWAQNLLPNQPVPPLPDVQLPDEVMDLVEASQRSLERLNTALAIEKRQAAEVAHALRTPLAVLVARLDALPPGEQTERLRRDVQALSRTVMQVLAAARADALDINDDASTDLVEVAQRVVAASSPLAHRHSVELSLHAPQDPIIAVADPDAVELAISNLVENAILHGQHSPVDVTVTRDCQVLVRDHGAGLPPGSQNQLFEAFWRGESAVEGGSGLGLAIVQRLQKAQGGEVLARPADGPGAEFVLTYRLAKIN